MGYYFKNKAVYKNMTMHTVCFSLASPSCLDRVWSELEELGCTVLFSSEDLNSFSQIYAQVPEGADISTLSSIVSWEEAPLPGIDWEAQWALHAPGYKDGYVWIDLKQYGSKKNDSPIKLKPGPGFGDLSHPTTNLVIRMLVDIVEGRDVYDIGCGSGVLSLCAAAVGARSVQGIDIDPSVVAHARENAVFNNMQEKVLFFLPSEECIVYSPNPVILMNMIWSEQQEVWPSLPMIPADFLISGIHLSEREVYLDFISQHGLEVLQESTAKEWLAFHCQ